MSERTARPVGLTPRARVALVVLGFALVGAVGLVHVARRRAIVQVGYELSHKTTELRRLEEEERRLNLELSVLTAPARIERLAGDLGMIRPPATAIRVVRSRPPVARAR